ncbi:type I DNA topoisomerase [candidate division WOR-3 bacterium]|nr:type I DNA topoisomerase [candidate division WOR-3 bacterium]
MAKNLLIVESPTKAKTITKIVGKDFSVLSTFGHIKDMPVSRLGVDVEDNFKTIFVLNKTKLKQIVKIKESAKKADTVYIATDPDREGEAIAQHISEELPSGKSVKRLLFYEMTPKAINEAIKTPGEIDCLKVDSQNARRILDRLVGYKVSPLLWKRIKSGLSAGRVQTVALKLICERENERRKFVSQEYWDVMFVLEKDGKLVTAALSKKAGRKIKIESGKEAEKLTEQVKNNTVKVLDMTFQERKKKPKPPYTTSTLQQDAVTRLGYSASRTMMVAQKLFEGVDIENETVGLITYMRTDSVRVSPEAVSQARKFMSESGLKRLLPEKPNKYADSKKNVQSAHEAVRPTDLFKTPDSLKGKIEKDMLNLYSMIWKRFIASQCRDAVEKISTLTFSAGTDLELRASRTETVFDGFKHFFDGNGEENETEKLPDLKKGDEMKVVSEKAEQHFTQPPARFTEASLIKELDALGIGRPSTYAPIISIIVERGYVLKSNRSLSPTKLGEVVLKYLVESFPEVFNEKFTALMEERLDEIEQGKSKKETVLVEFYKPFGARMEQVKNSKITIEIPENEKICPVCGKQMALKNSRYGSFLGCTDYPKCKGKKDIFSENDNETETEIACPKCGQKMISMNGRYGKYLRCRNYPQCPTTTPYYIGVDCPHDKCRGKIAEKKSAKGRNYWTCDECKAVFWTKPISRKCPNCKSNAMLEKKTKKGTILTCPLCNAVVAPEEYMGEMSE